MREAIGGTWLFQIVIAFVLLFTGYMCLTINHTKAFNVKNEIINEIERAGGIDLADTEADETIKTIVSYLKDVSYRTTGSCPSTGDPSNEYVGISREGKKVSNNNAAFCILKQNARVQPEFQNEDGSISNYYRVVVFYQLDLPIFNSLFNFQVKGDTRITNSSYTRNGIYRTSGQKCQEYRNGKPFGKERPCTSQELETLR